MDEGTKWPLPTSKLAQFAQRFQQENLAVLSENLAEMSLLRMAVGRPRNLNEVFRLADRFIRCESFFADTTGIHHAVGEDWVD